MNDYYELWWGNPADIRHCITDRLFAHLVTRVSAGHGSTALDLGSGKGRVISLLQERGYRVTGIDSNEKFVADMSRRFPAAKIISGDVVAVTRGLPRKPFDAVTCIELAQNLSPNDFRSLLRELRPITKRIFINISNKHSLHGWWSNYRKMRAPFVFEYTALDLEKYLTEAGFTITHTAGFGFITPLSLLPGFKYAIIPQFLANSLSFLDAFFPRACHFLYAEAE